MNNNSVGPSSRQAADSFYRPELDVLRFWCFLLVFLHHGLPRVRDTVASAFVDMGAFGMPVFFLLSSFLITELLLREINSTGTVQIPSFYVRRVLRIWPLYFTFFAFCFVMGRAHLMMQPLSIRATLFFSLLAGNWYLVLYGPIASAMVVLWSISVEEQFYLFWPWLMRLGGARAVRWTAWIVSPLAYVALWFLAHRGADADTGLWTNTFVQMQFFALGGFLALYLQKHKPIFSIAARSAFVVCMLASWFVAAYWCRVKRNDLRITAEHACIGYALMAVGTLCTFLMFYDLHIGRGRLAQAAIYLGKISFGLYVFHYFALLTAAGAMHHLLPRQNTIAGANLLGLVLTIVFASLSYHLLEKPLLRYKKRFTFVHSRPL